MAQRITPSVEPKGFPQGGGSLEDLALQVAGDGPSVVLFLNQAQAPDPRSPDGKLVQQPIRNSLSVKAMFLEAGHTDDDLGLAVHLFKIKTVDVSSVPAEASKEVNRGKAPFIVVVGVEGKVVGTLGPSIPTRPQVVDLLAKALKPKADLRKILALERKLIRDMMRMGVLEEELGVARKKLEEAGGDNAGKSLGTTMEKQVAKREAEIAALQAEIDREREEADAAAAALSQAGQPAASP